ncbi:hypothetical protein GZ77_01820 [Endozoicomonas montiporae]|uniref:Uncharacterized protein n=2 Tax=Endozoicomonas montiporae TaxID=1027273 RepID=A0A081NAD7_9GAMM|nr:hypothetical protein EZMO1_2866 [Endozoicomonas montiporae CL-33]KEQ15410.1 hypothetical protein GZ77_01820 [Endozoicomonas montiporae]
MISLISPSVRFWFFLLCLFVCFNVFAAENCTECNKPLNQYERGICESCKNKQSDQDSLGACAPGPDAAVIVTLDESVVAGIKKLVVCEDSKTTKPKKTSKTDSCADEGACAAAACGTTGDPCSSDTCGVSYSDQISFLTFFPASLLIGRSMRG